MRNYTVRRLVPGIGNGNVEVIVVDERSPEERDGAGIIVSYHHSIDEAEAEAERLRDQGD